ncbi:uncharacterized membrane protein At3g27390 isoform X1 [Cryptomeria japonica]|uniref:uncharacterized membrane protein At3g27390 isoform X1 n=1 Tax=Cryptomeria japonica TaxID=3369 RepID=UPI0025AC6D2D|nr:uncharacterized membrane protein At3g27390 isoform X1 [Cryptomeria japonica]
MDTPRGFAEILWSFLSFLPYFMLLFLLGAVKGIIFCPIVCLIMTVGNSAVILGLWPAHVIWTYYCVIKAKSIGPTLKSICCICLPLPLILWPVVAITGSILAGLSYGLLTPLVATFEAVGEEHENKLVDCFLDGTWSTIKGSCTVVRDFTDICFHSYFSVMDELYEQQPKNGKPLDIKLLQLPGCVLVGLLGVIVDVPMMSLIALFKAPYMLYKGWQRLLHDLIGREGPFLETVCVPFAGLAILLWPLVVVVALVSAIMSSLFLGLYAGVVVYQESSFYLGLAYVVSSVALFDEYTNDLLYMREGSCFRRLKYRRNTAALSGRFSRRYSLNKEIMDEKDGSIAPGNERRGPQRTKSLKKTIQELNTVQIWDQLFESYKTIGMALVDEDVVKVSDIEEWNHTGKYSVLTTGLPAYCILKNLLHSAKYNSEGFMLSDGIELTSLNRPEDRVFEWFFEPLLIIKEQIMAENLQESEELYLEKLVLLSGFPDRMKAWQNGGISPEDDIRRAELEALSRRLQGIAKLISRIPTFRRRFQNVVRTLNVEAQSRASSSIHSSISIRESSISNSNLKPGNYIGTL